jgi:hypothetical protein
MIIASLTLGIITLTVRWTRGGNIYYIMDPGKNIDPQNQYDSLEFREL